MDGDEVDFHIGGAWPLDEAFGEGNLSAFLDDHSQATFPCIALPNGIGCHHAHSSTGFEEIKGTAVKCGAKVSSSFERCESDLKVLAIFVAQSPADFQSTQKWWVAQHHIKATLLENFWELKFPVEEAMFFWQVPKRSQ
jgi:hypothetical protein